VDTDIIPIPQMNPATGKMEKGFKVKGGKDGMDGSLLCFIVAVCVIFAVGFAIYWTVRKVRALYRRRQAKRLAAREAYERTLPYHVKQIKSAVERWEKNGRTNVQIV
jgi:heme/copper-type cytochrome/quinol oxidase subunit 3